MHDGIVSESPFAQAASDMDCCRATTVLSDMDSKMNQAYNASTKHNWKLPVEATWGIAELLEAVRLLRTRASMRIGRSTSPAVHPLVPELELARKTEAIRAAARTGTAAPMAIATVAASTSLFAAATAAPSATVAADFLSAAAAFAACSLLAWVEIRCLRR